MLELVVIEHLEPRLSKWLLIEYEHVSEIVGRERLWFTNVKGEEDRRRLEPLAARVLSERVWEVKLPYDVIVLDPLAPSELTPEDFSEPACVVVGGIMGDYPPVGRTREELTSKLQGAKARNIGPWQFQIDGAVYVAVEVNRGRRLREIPLILGLTLKSEEGHEIYLPYAYPVVNGKPLISKKEVEYILKELEEDEAELIKREGAVLSVASL